MDFTAAPVVLCAYVSLERLELSRQFTALPIHHVPSRSATGPRLGLGCKPGRSVGARQESANLRVVQHAGASQPRDHAPGGPYRDAPVRSQGHGVDAAAQPQK
jgi:hypothetical protein